MGETISSQVKRTCVEMKNAGSTAKEIYDSYFNLQLPDQQSFLSFQRSLNRWGKRTYPDDTTLNSGTYEGFTAHGATVQVSANGEIVQAWIKQHADEIDPTEFLEALQGNVEKYEYQPKAKKSCDGMLEIPLFDMHWGVSYIDHYEPALNAILEIIHERYWDRIVIPFGQDFFHNDSVVYGQTTKGTAIEKVDMVKAVKEGQIFIYAVIDAAIESSNEVQVVYSPGNHDRSISWMFMQTLLERYGLDIVDDTMQFRKVITYGNNSIMITHGDSKQATPKNLAHIFPVMFPEEFSNATIREVHAGHLHHETDSDIYGVMVRRLSSGGAIDEWSDKEDFVGTHRRFMLFDWGINKLRSIRYI